MITLSTYETMGKVDADYFPFAAQDYPIIVVTFLNIQKWWELIANICWNNSWSDKMNLCQTWYAHHYNVPFNSKYFKEFAKEW